MPEQDEVGKKAADIGKGLGDIMVWLVALLAGLAGYAMPQAGFDTKKIVTNLMTVFKLNNLFPAGSTTADVYSLIAGAILTGGGGVIMYWGIKYDKLVGAVAKILGAHLLGRGIRFIFVGLGG